MFGIILDELWLSNRFWKSEIILVHMKRQTDLSSLDLSTPYSGGKNLVAETVSGRPILSWRARVFTEELRSSQGVGELRKTPRSLLTYAKVEPGKSTKCLTWAKPAWENKSTERASTGRELCAGRPRGVAQTKISDCDCISECPFHMVCSLY